MAASVEEASTPLSCAQCEIFPAILECSDEELLYCDPCSASLHSKKARAHHHLKSFRVCDECEAAIARLQCLPCAGKRSKRALVFCAGCSAGLHSKKARRHHEVELISSSCIRNVINVTAQVNESCNIGRVEKAVSYERQGFVSAALEETCAQATCASSWAGGCKESTHARESAKKLSSKPVNYSHKDAPYVSKVDARTNVREISPVDSPLEEAPLYAKKEVSHTKIVSTRIEKDTPEVVTREKPSSTLCREPSHLANEMACSPCNKKCSCQNQIYGDELLSEAQPSMKTVEFMPKLATQSKERDSVEPSVGSPLPGNDRAGTSRFSLVQGTLHCKRDHSAKVTREALVINGDAHDTSHPVIGHIRSMLQQGLCSSTPNERACETLKHAQAILVTYNLKQAGARDGSLQYNEVLKPGYCVVKFACREIIRRVRQRCHLDDLVYSLAPYVAKLFATNYCFQYLKVIFYGIAQNATCASTALAAIYNRIATLSAGYAPKKHVDAKGKVDIKSRSENKRELMKPLFQISRWRTGHPKQGETEGIKDGKCPPLNLWLEGIPKNEALVEEYGQETMEALIMHCMKACEELVEMQGWTFCASNLDPKHVPSS